jgi:hypothetical protein
MDSSILHTGFIHAHMFGAPVRVAVSISASYRTILDFSLQGCAYTFTIDKWRSRNLTGFLQRFHQHACRDAETYGSIATDDEGLVTVNMNVLQKTATVIHAAQDVLACLEKICVHYQRAVLDYAVWYREHRREEITREAKLRSRKAAVPLFETYSQYISRITSHCIVHADLMAPNMQWEVVEF